MCLLCQRRGVGVSVSVGECRVKSVVEKKGRVGGVKESMCRGESEVVGWSSWCHTRSERSEKEKKKKRREAARG